MRGGILHRQVRNKGELSDFFLIEQLFGCSCHLLQGKITKQVSVGKKLNG